MKNNRATYISMAKLNNKKNIKVDDGFPERLRCIRTRLNLTRGELADKAGISEKTIRAMESAKRDIFMEKTLMLLAAGLEVRLEELFPPARTLFRTHRAALILALILIVGMGSAAAFRTWDLNHAVWTVEDHHLSVLDPVFNIKLWDSGNEPRVRSCMDSPWSDRHILVGLGSTTMNGGRLLCLNRADADTVWSLRPDVEAIARAFGQDDAYAAGYACTSLDLADLDGDGRPEVVAGFCQGLLYPNAICMIGEGGKLQSQYVNRGHLFDILVTDLNRDGKDEIIATGTNNAYAGPTVIILDDTHRTGASLDDRSIPSSTEPDSALVRLVIPAFPPDYMIALSDPHLTAFIPRVNDGADGKPRLNMKVGKRQVPGLALTLDQDLNILDCVPEDAFITLMKRDWPDSLWRGTGPMDPDWIANWLSGSRRFVAGHWPPPSGSGK